MPPGGSSVATSDENNFKKLAGNTGFGTDCFKIRLMLIITAFCAREVSFSTFASASTFFKGLKISFGLFRRVIQTGFHVLSVTPLNQSLG